MCFFNTLNANNWLYEQLSLDLKSGVNNYDYFLPNGSEYLLYV